VQTCAISRPEIVIDFKIGLFGIKRFAGALRRFFVLPGDITVLALNRSA